MKRTTKHGQQLMKDESPARRRIWKAQRRKVLRANDKRAVKED